MRSPDLNACRETANQRQRPAAERDLLVAAASGAALSPFLIDRIFV
jgi:hypothetical protein